MAPGVFPVPTCDETGNTPASLHNRPLRLCHLLSLWLSHSPVRFEVWDRDNGWNDDLLGRVSLVPTSGRVSRTFRLKHGSLLVHVAAACAPSLQGALCQQYAASPTYQEVMGSRREEGAGPPAAPPQGATL